MQEKAAAPAYLTACYSAEISCCDLQGGGVIACEEAASLLPAEEQSVLLSVSTCGMAPLLSILARALHTA